ncbi:MAG: HAMP domain-containing sensor histidine kinase [Synechococcus sp.]|nr:HAMP domain-containing sensor histidine kinase [Synechococcus sp.]
MALATGSVPPLPPDPLLLRRRLAVQGGGFALLLLAAFSGTLYWDIAVQRAEDQRSELRQLAASAAAQLPLIVHEMKEAEGSAKFRDTPGRIAAPGLEQQRLQWFDARGVLLREQGTLPMPVPLPGRRVASVGGVEVSPPADPLWQQWPGGVSLWQPVDRKTGGNGRPRVERLGFVRVALSDQAARADLERLRRGLLLGGIVTVLAALLVGRRMLRSAFLPLQRQVSALQRFTADASHELRHPLTILRTLLAAVPQELRQQPALAWGELEETTRRLGQLLDDLLLIARQEQAGVDGVLQREEGQVFDLLELLEDLIRCHTPQAAARRIDLLLTPSPLQHTIPVCGHSEELWRLFTNLLLNAIRHSPEGAAVSVHVNRTGRRIRVAVVDGGPGIPSEAQEQVFERFWRGSDRGGHSGLGLAIGRAIARRHGGTLGLGENRPGRCELLVELPAA